LYMTWLYLYSTSLSIPPIRSARAVGAFGGVLERRRASTGFKHTNDADVVDMLWQKLVMLPNRCAFSIAGTFMVAHVVITDQS